MFTPILAMRHAMLHAALGSNTALEVLELRGRRVADAVPSLDMQC